MYEDTYTEFDPAQFQYGQYRQKFLTGDPPYAEWDYGDTLHLYFNLKDVLEDPNSLFDFDRISRIRVIFTVYNFMYDIIYEAAGALVDLIDASGTISVDIDCKLSQLMKPGTYNCSIVLEQENIRLTVINPSSCVLRVR